MYEDKFSNRLSQLRMKKGVSAREMSISLGQNPGYINSIESGKALPTMSNFFYICDYLDISPMEFFNFDINNPKETDILYNAINQLTDSQFKNIKEIVNDLNNTNR